MLNKTLIRTLAIALAATLSFAGVTACDPPEEADEPVSEEAEDEEAAEAPQEAEQEQHAQLEAPDEAAIDGPDDHPMAGGPPQIDGEVSDEDLDNFAEAIDALQALEQDADGAQARMMEAETPEEQMEVLQELMAEAEAAVEDTGMDLMTVEGMAQRIQHDDDLQERVDAHEDIDLEQLMAPAQPQQGQPPAGGPGEPPAGGPGGGDAPELEAPELNIE